jgi:hypothetical protein
MRHLALPLLELRSPQLDEADRVRTPGEPLEDADPAVLAQPRTLLGIAQHLDDHGRQCRRVSRRHRARALTVGADDLSWPNAEEPLLDTLPRGRPVAAAGVLFTKIEDAQVAEWSAQFGGAST